MSLFANIFDWPLVFIHNFQLLCEHTKSTLFANPLLVDVT